MDALCSLQSISANELNLAGHNLGDQSALAIGQALAKNYFLQTLCLSNNNIRERGTGFIAESLSRCYLTSLDLSHNSIGEFGALAIAKATKYNRQLRRLELEGNTIPEKGCRGLVDALAAGGAPSLLHLGLSLNVVGDQAGVTLAELLPMRPGCCVLDSLGLRRCHVGRKTPLAFAEALTSDVCPLRTLDFSWNTVGGDAAEAIADALVTNAGLMDLGLAGCSIGEGGARAFADILNVPGVHLTCLDLTDNAVGEVGASALAVALQANPKLTSLNLSENNVGDRGVGALADGIHCAESLVALDLSSNHVGRCTCGCRGNCLVGQCECKCAGPCVEGVARFAATLGCNTSLKTLKFCGNPIGNLGAIAFADGLKENNTLTTLDLKSNAIAWEGITHIAEYLAQNTSLTTLGLCGNEAGEFGASALADSLLENGTLTSLDLMGNDIGDAGAQAFVRALASNRSLRSLDLMSNGISVVGTLALSKAIEANGTLASLDLMCNDIRDAGAEALTAALEANKSLTSVHLAMNKLQDEDALRVEDAMELNREFVVSDI